MGEGSTVSQIPSTFGWAILSNGEAQKIKALCNAPDPYDKKATQVTLKSQVQLRDPFCSQKHNQGANEEACKFINTVS